jgi:hypothetical protein
MSDLATEKPSSRPGDSETVDDQTQPGHRRPNDGKAAPEPDTSPSPVPLTGPGRPPGGPVPSGR